VTPLPSFASAAMTIGPVRRSRRWHSMWMETTRGSLLSWSCRDETVGDATKDVRMPPRSRVPTSKITLSPNTTLPAYPSDRGYNSFFFSLILLLARADSLIDENGRCYSFGPVNCMIPFVAYGSLGLLKSSRMSLSSLESCFFVRIFHGPRATSFWTISTWPPG